MLDMIKVEVYGQQLPINQLATVSVPEARLISIQVWDKSNVQFIDSSIKKSELGINPQVDGQIIRVRIPDLTEERRKELIKIVKSMAEKSKISVRNIRRDGNENLKKDLKDKKISEDENKKLEKNIQNLTDENIKNIEKILEEKEKEILNMNQLNHVAFIMDGNGRWGKKRRKTRNYGHFNGVKTVKRLLKLRSN